MKHMLAVFAAWLAFSVISYADCPAVAPNLPITTYSANGVYVDMLYRENISHASNVKMDANGIPTVFNGSTYIYNPSTIAQYGLQQFSYYVANGVASGRTNMLVIADWLVQNQDSQTGYWYFNFDFSVGGMGVTLKAPWGSAGTQGQAISVLVRAFNATGDSKYNSAAHHALKPFTKNRILGGVLEPFLGNSNLPHYDAYPTNPPTYALNGFMAALIGLYDLTTIDPTINAFYQPAIKTLEAELPYHDDAEMSAYHLGHITNPPRAITQTWSYHQSHVYALGALAFLNPGSTTIQYYNQIWCSYRPPLQ